jgi:hypothetical protein
MKSKLYVGISCAVLGLSSCAQRKFGESELKSTENVGIGESFSAFTPSKKAKGYITTQKKETREVTSCKILMTKKSDEEQQFQIAFLNGNDVLASLESRFSSRDLRHGGHYQETTQYDVWFLLDKQSSISAYYLKDRPGFLGKIEFEVTCFFGDEDSLKNNLQNFVKMNKDE